MKNVVPFLKVDKGLADEVDGAQVMKPMPGLDALLARAVENGVFGTKMRSVIKLANDSGVQAMVDQQFEVGRQILAAAWCRSSSPRSTSTPPEGRGRGAAQGGDPRELGALSADQHVMLKLTLPEVDDFYADLVAHPNVLRVVALSGGYSREEANARLARHTTVSRASPGRSPKGSPSSRATKSSTPPSTHRSAASSRRPPPDPSRTSPSDSSPRGRHDGPQCVAGNAGEQSRRRWRVDG